MRIARAVIFAVTKTLLLVSCATTFATAQANTPVPVTSNASPEARGLLKFLYSISGKYILTGQHNFPNHGARWTDRAYDFTGKYPAVFGQDFGFSGGEDKDSIEARPAIIEEIKRQWRNGAIPTLTWHAVRPSSDEPVTFRENVQSDLSDFEWSELLTPGTALNERWREQVDLIAGYLKQLRDAHVPVLWRPYHEMNGNWFWWGGRPGKNGSAALYRQMFDRFVNFHKLDNLIWVWNVNTVSNNAGSFADYFPGTEYVDVVSVDNYGPWEASFYNDALTLAAGKPIALGEVGAVPGPEVLQAQPRWTWFMTWSDLVEWLNTPEKLRAVFSAPSALNRDDPRMAGPLTALRKGPAPSSPSPVTADATEEAKELLSRLYEVSGQSVLSGQANDVRTPSASTAQIIQFTAKSPAIHAQDLGVPKEGGMDSAAVHKVVLEEAIRQHQNHVVVSLSWRPARPTDSDPATAERIQEPLSDFEWNQLLTPGTNLNKLWIDQVDAVARSLKELADANVAVLWQPYPESNGKKFWWAGRKGTQGSMALYRRLFDRLTNHDKLRNLIWVWTSVPPAGFGPAAEGQYKDFFPGLGYVDALALNIDVVNPRGRADTFLAMFALGKPIGLGLAAEVPESFPPQSKWAWFILGSSVPAPANSGAIIKLYSDPRTVSSNQK